MKKYSFLLFLAVSFRAVAQFNPPPVSSSIHNNYYALIIACKDYNDNRGRDSKEYFGNLDSTISEAKQLESVLKNQYGFTTIHLFNPKFGVIDDSIKNISRRMSLNDNLLIFFSGHGVTDGDLYYLVPICDNYSSHSIFLSTANFTSYLYGCKSNHILEIFDACYSASMDVQEQEVMKGGSAYVPQLEKMRSIQKLYSSGFNPSSGISVFTEKLILELNKNEGILSTTNLFNNIEDDMSSSNSSMPTHRDDGDGEFYFKSVNAIESVVRPAANPVENTVQHVNSNSAVAAITIMNSPISTCNNLQDLLNKYSPDNADDANLNNFKEMCKEIKLHEYDLNNIIEEGASDLGIPREFKITWINDKRYYAVLTGNYADFLDYTKTMVSLNDKGAIRDLARLYAGKKDAITIGSTVKTVNPESIGGEDQDEALKFAKKGMILGDVECKQIYSELTSKTTSSDNNSETPKTTSSASGEKIAGKNNTEEVKEDNTSAKESIAKPEVTPSSKNVDNSGDDANSFDDVSFLAIKTVADTGNVKAEKAVGYRYLIGDGVTKDIYKAEDYYQKAANTGDLEAEYNLGYCYFKTNDIQNAAIWYQKAADGGYAEAQYVLGAIYLNGGNGVKPDLNQAFKLFQAAANAQNINAIYNLGFCYYSGYGVNVDYSQAVTWFQKAVDNGKLDAQVDIGDCYFNGGHGLTRDDSQAFEWYKKAADRGNAEAEYDLGNCYNTGRGVALDKQTAKSFYHKAADQGNADAKNALQVLGN